MSELNEAEKAEAERAEPPAGRPPRALLGNGPSAPGPSAAVRRFACRALRAEIDALGRHLPAQAATPEPNAVHRLRIAARRIRVWLRMFGPYLPQRDAERISSEVRWFGRELGAVRDLDVYAEHLPAYIAAAGISAQDLGGYELDLRRARTRARAGLGAVFADPRLKQMLDDLAELAAALEGGPELAAGAETLEQFASRRLRRGVKRLRKHGREVSADSPARRLHRLRIEAKRLRYELEFFAAAYPALGAAAKTVKGMQDLLGEFQDACVASANLERYAVEDAGSERAAGSLGPEHPIDRRQAFALGRLMQAQLDRAAQVRQEFAAAWPPFDRELKRVKKEIAKLA